MRSGPDLLPQLILGQHLVPDLRAPGAGAEADPVPGGG